ncbi:aspartic proteinase-like protein 1 isoform X1 [Tripterygium wilfordii]|uniref:Aspartic proteinase-like protein 1 isoform X1 n=1 Tax=Tripterygium wilfordii TaxID=458696 RepID=A0A7J7CV57_TRIWF|nr:aspartic proteinase-like protein 1 isoform X2 [Tripterygium wilfordii]KAF5737970.1 aspartic proteinase-like protein 1 isoform X1 [Tripterygium wilfordii]
MGPHSLALLVFMVASIYLESAVAMTLSTRLIHRYSEEVMGFRVSSGRNVSGSGTWPEKRSLEYYRMLANSDFQRQKMKLAPQYRLLFPSEGSKTMAFGNDFGWLHYMWIDIGTPKVSFLVALDAGTDLLWIPCDCVQCAPLSASYYSSLDRDLNEYSPSASSTSKHVSCSHQLCDSNSKCKSPKQQCPYTINYYTENTSSSGLLVEDTLHLASGVDDTLNASVQASVIIGCGMKQSGGYLDGVAPDGLMGLGLGELAIPSFLASAGLIKNSFSMCFDEDGSGRIFFGDKGQATQQSTSFLPLDGKYITYIVGVEASCVGNSCPKQTSFRALVDSGTSFTFLPDKVYEAIAEEFDKGVNASISTFEGYPWKYCYKTSSPEVPKVPALKFMFPLNNSFVIRDPIFPIYGMQGVTGFCLAVQPADGDIGTIGQNFMTGYRVVFDRGNLTLGWSRSKCQDLSKGMSLPPPPEVTPLNPLPTNEQQRAPNGHAVSPAVAGRAPSKPSSASTQSISSQFLILKSLFLLFPLHRLVSAF